MNTPQHLPSLSPREAITDAAYRGVLGLDTDDKALFDSAFTKDANFDLNGNVMSGLDAIHTGCFDSISKLDTTHFLSNVRVNVPDGSSKATMTCSALAQHYRRGQGTAVNATRFLTGALYSFDMVEDREHGLWKIQNWSMKLTWTEGDMGVLTGN